MKRCRSCHKEIEDGAKKCDKCGSYQTFVGRFINMGIPIISIMLALVSWGQAYIENQEKKAAIREKKAAEKIAVVAEEQKEIAREEVIHYQQAFVRIEEQVQELKRLNIASPNYQEKLRTISDQLEVTNQPVKVIDGQRYKRIE